jgi:hypothetical protein
VTSEQTPLSFPEWKAALIREPWPPAKTESFRREILSFLRHCKQRHAPATVALIKRYLSEQEKRGAGQAREALRWFYQAARKESGSTPSPATPGQPRAAAKPSATARAGLASEMRDASGPNADRMPVSPDVRADESQARGVEIGDIARDAVSTSHALAGGTVRPGNAGLKNIPPTAATDLGGADWERDLVRAAREAGLMWRTEETYRGWAARFARFIAPRSPYAANGNDVAAFLSQMAVDFRASSATQKQALNALVFFMQEGLKRDLGKMEFHFAAAQRRVPTVLSREECRRLFAELTGTERLMAELAYGAGLRLMELLRLRVHHVDLERQRVIVHGGKGDKDRVTVLPESLRPALTRQLERLRELYAEDRAAKRTGVWLPDGLARKYPRAGEKWAWQWLFP